MLGCKGRSGSCGKKYGGCEGRCRECVEVWGEVRKDVWRGCGRVYGVSGEVCRRVGKGCGEGNGGDVGKCTEVWGPNTLLIPCISLPSPTPHHTFLHLLSYLFPHLPPHSNTFSYYPYITLHFLKVLRSYHVTKFLWRSYCGKVTMWQSYWQPFSLTAFTSSYC